MQKEIICNWIAFMIILLTQTACAQSTTGCSFTTSLNVTLVAQPTPLFTQGGNYLITAGENTTLAVEGTYATYQWSNTANTPTIAVAFSGVYTVAVANDAGCEGAAEVSVQLDSSSLPKLIGADADMLVTNNTNAVAYQWYLNGAPLAGTNVGTLPCDASGTYTVSVTYSNGFVAVTPPFQCTVGTTQVNDFVATVYPNPTNNQLNIRLATPLRVATISLLDMNGRSVWQQNLQEIAAYEINTSTLSSGSYVLRIESNGKQFRQEIIIKH